MAGETLEKYVEAISELKNRPDAEERVHTKQIAQRLEVKEASVTEMMKRLDEKNLIDYQPYRGVKLTEEGNELAEKLHYSHRVLADFFKSLGVDEEVAETDACRIEHVVNDETINKLSSFVDYISGDTGAPVVDEFRNSENNDRQDT